MGGLLFTGCAHSGLENILSACPYPVKTVVGGFHLLDHHENEAALSALSHRLADAYPQTQFYTSHCTGDAVFAIMLGVMGDKIHSFSCGTTICNMTDNIGLHSKGIGQAAWKTVEAIHPEIHVWETNADKHQTS